MRGANMSVKGCEVVECFSTRIASERAFSGSLVLGF